MSQSPNLKDLAMASLWTSIAGLVFPVKLAVLVITSDQHRLDIERLREWPYALCDVLFVTRSTSRQHVLVSGAIVVGQMHMEQLRAKPGVEDGNARRLRLGWSIESIEPTPTEAIKPGWHNPLS